MACGVPEVSEAFPRYTEFDPAVPIWCVTPDVPGCIHRFFDTPAISPSGRYLAAFALPFEDRTPHAKPSLGTRLIERVVLRRGQGPRPRRAGHVVLVDLLAGTQRRVAESWGWEPQLGANVNWGGDENTLFFNDVDRGSWEAFAVKLNPHSGKRERLEGTVYHASPDGRWLASANLLAMGRTQHGYGVVVPYPKVPRHVGPIEDDGVWLTNTQTGEAKMVVSLAELMRVAASPKYGPPEAMEVYGFHSKFSPCGRRLLFTTRWCKHKPEPAFGLHGGRPDLRYTVFTMDLNRDAPDADGFPSVENLQATIGDEEWEKHGHHVNWFPDGNALSTNLRIDRDEMRFVRCNLDGSELRDVVLAAEPRVIGSGHPSIHPTAGHFLTDVYAHEPLAFGDGTTPLRWVNLNTGEEQCVARFMSETPTQKQDPVLRLDPHPAWDRTWTHVAFNAFLNGTRRVMIADMRSLL